MWRCCSTSPWAVLSKAGAQSSPWTALGVVQQALRRVDENSSDHSLLACGLRQLIFILLWAHGVPSYQAPLPGTGTLRWGYVLGTSSAFLWSSELRLAWVGTGGCPLIPSSILKKSGCWQFFLFQDAQTPWKISAFTKPCSKSKLHIYLKPLKLDLMTLPSMIQFQRKNILPFAQCANVTLFLLFFFL